MMQADYRLRQDVMFRELSVRQARGRWFELSTGQSAEIHTVLDSADAIESLGARFRRPVGA